MSSSVMRVLSVRSAIDQGMIPERNHCTVINTRFDDPVAFAFVTKTGIKSARGIRKFGTSTVIVVAVIEVGTRIAAPKFTQAPAAKPVPVIVRVNLPELAVTVAGESPKGTVVMVGAPTVPPTATTTDS